MYNPKDFDLFRKSKGISAVSLYQFSSIVNITPNVIETSDKHPIIMNVFDRLMQDRIITLGTAIDSVVANIVNAQLLYLESTGDADITMYLNTPGGSVIDGMSTVDIMNYIKPDVATVTTGMSASMGLILATSGKRGKRSALPHSRFLLHQPLGSSNGQSDDMQIVMNEMLKLKKELYDIVVETTGQSYEKVEKDAQRDYWLTAIESKEYGIIDTVITKK